MALSASLFQTSHTSNIKMNLENNLEISSKSLIKKNIMKQVIETMTTIKW